MKFSILILFLIFAISAKAEITVNVPVVVGKYTLVDSVNFVDYMKAVGVGIITRNLAAVATPVTDISQVGSNWHFKTTTTFASSDITFQLGVPFTEVTPDGRTCMSTLTLLDDHTFKHVQKNCGGGVDGLVITREFTGTQLKMVLTAPDSDGKPIVCTRVYRKD